jgi:ribosomal-protein-alanine N-acetyltransferase
VDSVAAIEVVSFSNPWQPQTFRSLVSQDRALILVAEVTGAGIVGYAVLWWVLDQGELANLAVREPFQGRGIGSALLDKVMRAAAARGVETVFLEVRSSNHRAYDLYLSRGFRPVGVRKGYYQNPKEDARILVKPLGE